MSSAVFLCACSAYRAVGARKEKLWACEGEGDPFTQLRTGREDHEAQNRSVSQKHIGFVLFTEAPHHLPRPLANKKLRCKKTQDPWVRLLNKTEEYSVFVVLAESVEMRVRRSSRRLCLETRDSFAISAALTCSLLLRDERSGSFPRDYFPALASYLVTAMALQEKYRKPLEMM